MTDSITDKDARLLAMTTCVISPKRSLVIAMLNKTKLEISTKKSKPHFDQSNIYFGTISFRIFPSWWDIDNCQK